MDKIRKPSVRYSNAMLVILVINIPLCFALWGLFIMMAIGVWQVMDALFWVSKGDKRRRTYMLTVLLYLALLGGGFFLSDYSETFNMIIVPWFALFYVFIVSYGIAFWYWSITREHARSGDATAKENSGALDDLNNIA